MSRADARFIRESLLAAGAALALTVGFNALTDPTRSLYPSRGPATQVANDRAVKLDALMSRSDAPELLVMGSSSSAVLPPDAMAKALGYRSGYNLALVDGTPAEALAILQRLLAQGRAPKAITYGLDPMPFANPGGLPSERKKLLPGDSGWESLRVAARHLTAPLPASLMDYRTADALPLVLLDRHDGRLTYPRWEAAIDANPDRFEARVGRQARQGLRIAFHPGPFEDLRRLDGWLRQHQIDAIFFYPPVHADLRASTAPASRAEFVRRTAAALRRPVLDLYVASHPNQAGQFYDPVHYRSVLGEAIASQLGAAFGTTRLANIRAPISSRLPTNESSELGRVPRHSRSAAPRRPLP